MGTRSKSEPITPQRFNKLPLRRSIYCCLRKFSTTQWDVMIILFEYSLHCTQKFITVWCYTDVHNYRYGTVSVLFRLHDASFDILLATELTSNLELTSLIQSVVDMRTSRVDYNYISTFVRPFRMSYWFIIHTCIWRTSIQKNSTANIAPVCVKLLEYSVYWMILST